MASQPRRRDTVDLQATIAALQALVDAGYSELPLRSIASGEDCELAIPDPNHPSFDPEDDPEISVCFV
jgi:hypothetical protein